MDRSLMDRRYCLWRCWDRLEYFCLSLQKMNHIITVFIIGHTGCFDERINQDAVWISKKFQPQCRQAYLGSLTR